MSTQNGYDVHKVLSNEVGYRISGMLPSHVRKKAAKIIGVRYETLRRWCVGDIVPSSIHLPALAEYLGVSIRWILVGPSEEKQKEERPGDPKTKQLLAHYEKITEANICLIKHMENTITTNVRDNNEMYQKIEELKKSVSVCKKRLSKGKRKGDPKGFDPIKLRSIR